MVNTITHFLLRRRNLSISFTFVLSMRTLLALWLCTAGLSNGAEIQPIDLTYFDTDIDRIDSAVAQLNRTQLSSGFFPYDYNFKNGQATDMDAIDGLNLVRQTTALFSLGEYLAATKDETTTNTITTFLHKVAAESLPIGKGRIQTLLEWLGLYNRWQIWRPLREPLYKSGLLFSTHGEAKLVSLYGDYELAWPGATALSLSAALKYRQVTDDHQFDEIIRRWKDGLLALKVPGRGFREAPHYLSESPYVNGEAWLALAQYNKVFPEDKTTDEALLQLEEYIFEEYGNHFNLRFFHWGTMAAVARAQNGINKGRYDEIIYRLTDGYLNQAKKKNPISFNTCAAVEGLATFIGYMREKGADSDALVVRANEFVTQAMALNRRLQIDKRFAATLANRTQHLDALNLHRGAFVKSLEEPLMQIDFTEHCINAMLRMVSAGIAQ